MGTGDMLIGDVNFTLTSSVRANSLQPSQLWEKVMKNMNFPDHDISAQKALLLLDECLLECEQTDACVAVMHGTYGNPLVKNHCYLKNYIPPKLNDHKGTDVHQMKKTNRRSVTNNKNTCGTQKS